MRECVLFSYHDNIDDILDLTTLRSPCLHRDLLPWYHQHASKQLYDLLRLLLKLRPEVPTAQRKSILAEVELALAGADVSFVEGVVDHGAGKRGIPFTGIGRSRARSSGDESGTNARAKGGSTTANVSVGAAVSATTASLRKHVQRSALFQVFPDAGRLHCTGHKWTLQNKLDVLVPLSPGGGTDANDAFSAAISAHSLAPSPAAAATLAPAAAPSSSPLAKSARRKLSSMLSSTALFATSALSSPPRAQHAPVSASVSASASASTPTDQSPTNERAPQYNSSDLESDSDDGSSNLKGGEGQDGRDDQYSIME
jgi:hypothetical protein